MCLTCTCGFPQRPGEDTGPPGTKVTGSCALTDLSAGNRLAYSESAL